MVILMGVSVVKYSGSPMLDFESPSRVQGALGIGAAGFFFIMGIALLFTGLGFWYAGISPEVSHSEYKRIKEQIEQGVPEDQIYDRRYKSKNCVRMCKSKFPLFWVLPV